MATGGTWSKVIRVPPPPPDSRQGGSAQPPPHPEQCQAGPAAHAKGAPIAGDARTPRQQHHLLCLSGGDRQPVSSGSADAHLLPPPRPISISFDKARLIRTDDEQDETIGSNQQLITADVEANHFSFGPAKPFGSTPDEGLPSSVGNRDGWTSIRLRSTLSMISCRALPPLTQSMIQQHTTVATRDSQERAARAPISLGGCFAPAAGGPLEGGETPTLLSPMLKDNEPKISRRGEQQGNVVAALATSTQGAVSSPTPAPATEDDELSGEKPAVDNEEFWHEVNYIQSFSSDSILHIPTLLIGVNAAQVTIQPFGTGPSSAVDEPLLLITQSDAKGRVQSELDLANLNEVRPSVLTTYKRARRKNTNPVVRLSMASCSPISASWST